MPGQLTHLVSHPSQTLEGKGSAQPRLSLQEDGESGPGSQLRVGLSVFPVCLGLFFSMNSVCLGTRHAGASTGGPEPPQEGVKKGEMEELT